MLVVGAGPVGLWTALLLARAGLQVTIIDREERTAARSYACALHARTLALLQEAGLVEAVIPKGRRIPLMSFYEGEACRAQLKLSTLRADFPFLLILPQNAFEELLEAKLRELEASVYWNHRLDSLTEEEGGVAVSVDELSGTGTGYIVPHWETVVKQRSTVRAQLVIAADGANSTVRQRLGIGSETCGAAESFAAFEFEADQSLPDEVRVVLDERTTNVLWPLPENRCRWTFQVAGLEPGTEFPEKERRAVRVAQAQVDERIREYVNAVARKRAPWFSAGVKEITWCTEVVFQRRMARNFGRGRTWLVGDAAHQTGPVGVQSMNAAFVEAKELSRLAAAVVRGGTPVEALDAYNLDGVRRWQSLLGIRGGLIAGNGKDDWLRERRSRMLPCLPGSDRELEALAGQLGFVYQPGTETRAVPGSAQRSGGGRQTG